ncbi:MAG TPA: hypothetical protein VJZ76_06055 [Thermoanaerobaculia bacterium]|nr:hypothetical protein [Thermoanaerobaculia bacterium]
MTARDYAAAVATGSAVFGVAGTIPRVFYAFYGAYHGVRPFFSQFEVDLFYAVWNYIPKGHTHSMAAVVAFILLLWMIIGSVITALVWAMPFVRRRPLRQQMLIAAITPCVLLPLLAIAAPFEPGM